eukprot:3702321-Pleurochrysis_carterae.AAC.4
MPEGRDSASDDEVEVRRESGGVFGRPAWRDEKGYVLLRVGTERALRKRDARGSVPQPELQDIRKNPEGGVSLIQEQRRSGLPTVRRVFQYVLGAGIACGGKDRSRAAHELVRFMELSTMGRRNVG